MGEYVLSVRNKRTGAATLLVRHMGKVGDPTVVILFKHVASPLKWGLFAVTALWKVTLKSVTYAGVLIMT